MFRIVLFCMTITLLLLTPTFADDSQTTEKAASCGGETVSTTPWFDAQLSAYEITPLGPMECLEDSTTHETVETSDGTRSERTIRKKVTKRTWEYIDASGELRALDTTCTFVCSGSGCSNGGCDASAQGCSDWYCTSPVASNNCSGSCTKTSSSGSHPEPENKH
jgi:hypothetical protein